MGTLLAYCLAKPGVGVGHAVGRRRGDEWLMRYPEDASVMAYIGRSG
jgi:hypothetical protein